MKEQENNNSTNSDQSCPTPSIQFSKQFQVWAEDVKNNKVELLNMFMTMQRLYFMDCLEHNYPEKDILKAEGNMMILQKIIFEA